MYLPLLYNEPIHLYSSSFILIMSCIKRFILWTKHLDQNMLGYISSMITPTTLILEALSIMTWMTLYGPIVSIFRINGFVMLMSILNLSQLWCDEKNGAPVADKPWTLINGFPFIFFQRSDTMDTPYSFEESVNLPKRIFYFVFFPIKPMVLSFSYLWILYPLWVSLMEVTISFQ